MEMSWCEFCQYEAKAETIEKLMKVWDTHVETEEHEINFVKYLFKKTGAKTMEELPEKFHEYVDNEIEKREKLSDPST